MSAIPTAAAMADAAGMSASGATYMRFLLVEDNERAGARSRRVHPGRAATIGRRSDREHILAPNAGQYFT
jgi:hypothetical protein